MINPYSQTTNIYLEKVMKIKMNLTFFYLQVVVLKKIYIPSNIRIICSYAFSNCKNLTKIEIPTNPNLQTIEISGRFY